MNNMVVKSKVALELKAQGIFIPQEFDFSYRDFKKYFQLSMTKKKRAIYDDFYAQLKDKIGQNDLKLSDNWSDFVKSEFITAQIKDKLPQVDEITLQRIQKLLISKNIGNFKNDVYLPTIEHEIKKKLYSIDDFNSKEEAIEAGNEAIKLLYIPPFALGLSLVALLLNVVTVLGMLCAFLPITKVKALAIKGGAFALIIVLPLVFSSKSITNNLFEQVLSTSDTLRYYVNFIDWLTFYEILNAWIHQ